MFHTSSFGNETTGQVAISNSLLLTTVMSQEAVYEADLNNDGNDTVFNHKTGNEDDFLEDLDAAGMEGYNFAKHNQNWQNAGRASSMLTGALDEIRDNVDFEPAFSKEYNKSLAATMATLSYYRKRSTNSAYILLLGTSGSGKSSTTNIFFDAPVCETSDVTSCTETLNELSLLRPCNDLQMKNSKIVIVDTPGFKDSERGKKFDNQVLLKIKQYFEKKKHFPTLTLLTVNLWDNRIGGEFSEFAIYLRTIRVVLSEAVIDTNNPNLIIVATHCCQGNASKEQISERLHIVQKIAQQNLGLVYCPVVAAENDPGTYNLEKVGDFWKLSNGDIYPLNLYKTFVAMTQNTDPVGNAIINEAFPLLKTAGLKPTLTSLDIEETFDSAEENKSYKSQLEIIRKAADAAEGKYVSKNLAIRLCEHWDKMAEETKRACLFSSGEIYKEVQVFRRLGTLLGVRSYRKAERLPTTAWDKMSFFLQVSHSKAITKFFQQALELTPPKLPTQHLLGRFYNHRNNSVRPDFAFNLSAVSEVMNPMGLLVQTHVRASFKSDVRRICAYGDKSLLAAYRMNLFNLIPYDGNEQPEFRLQPGFNIKVNGDGLQEGNPSDFTVAFLQPAVKLGLRPGLSLTESVKTDLMNMKSYFDRSGKIVEEELKAFIRRNGAFYVKKVHLGGQVIFSFNQLLVPLNDLPHNDLEWTSFFFEAKRSSRDACRIKVEGGDEGLARLLEQSSSPQEFMERLQAWRNSLFEDLQVLELTMKVDGIWNLLGLQLDDPFLLKLESEVSNCTGLKLAPSKKTIFCRRKLWIETRAKTLLQVQSFTFNSIKIFGSVTFGSMATAAGIEGFGLAAGTGAAAAVADAAITGLVVVSGASFAIAAGVAAGGAIYYSYDKLRTVLS